jgi:hypothetical protein
MAAVAGVSMLASSCSGKNPPAADAIPADATALGAIDLSTLRAAPAYSGLPPAWKAIAEPLQSAKELVVAWNGKDLLLIAAGDFKEPPPGYTWINKGIAASGSAERLSAARQALAGGEKAKVQLPASEIRAELRAAIVRDGRLPFPGNLENLGNLLRMAQMTALTAYVESAFEVDIAAQCRSIEEARELEQSFRALVTVSASASKDPSVTEALRAMRIARESMIVHVHVLARPDVIAKTF